MQSSLSMRSQDFKHLSLGDSDDVAELTLATGM